MKKFSYSSVSALILTALLAASPAQAETLKHLLQQNLTGAPEVKEALADVEAARNRTEQSKSAHFPTVSVTGSKSLSQYHQDKGDYTSKKIIPGVQAELNLYAFGAIEKDVERSRKEEEYYRHNHAATREELGYTIGQLYLTALNMRESIAVMERSLARHQRILQDLSVVLENDEGRESEFVQAETRMLMVQQEINTYRQKLAATLNTLSKYNHKKISAETLSDPFVQLSPDELYHKYSLTDKAQNPLYQAGAADLEARNLSLAAEEKKRLPRVNLVGSATREDRQIGVQVAWDVFDRAADYTVRERASAIAAGHERLLRTARDLEESAALAKINIQESQSQLKTLKRQIAASEKVVDFYRLQFDVARRSLLDVLNAEKELSNAELAYSNTQHNLRQSKLDYLYTQGMISAWSGIKNQEIKLNFK